MLIIPTNPLPSQTLTTIVNGQNCQINLYQKTTGLYFDLYVNNAPLVLAVLCENFNLLVRDEYLGFLGDFFIADTQGSDDPDYIGMGTRYLLTYVFPIELL